MSFRPFQPVEHYAPRMLDPRRVMAANPQQLARDVMAANPGMPAHDAVQVVEALRAQALGRPIPATVNETIVQTVRGSAFLPTHLHARTTLTLPDSVIRPMREAIPIYLEQAAREKAVLRVFGSQVDEQMAAVFERLGARNPDVKLAEEVWSAFRGAPFQPESSREVKQVARILNNVATATLLGPQTAAIQASQFINLVGRLGVRPVWRGLVRVALQGGKADAERAGTFVNSLMDELVRVSKLPPTATRMDVVEQAVGRLASGVVRYSGIQAMDQFPRAVGYHAAKIALEDARRAAVLGNRRAVAALQQVGLTPEATADEISRAAAGLSRTINVTPNFADLPYILQTPIGAFARGLNTFNIQVVRMVAKEFVQPAMQYARTRGRQGALGPLARLVTGAVIGGDLLGEMRRWLAGRGGDRPGGPVAEFVGDLVAGRVPLATVAARAADALGWSGVVGILQSLKESLAFAMSGTEAATRAVGTLTGAGVSSAAEFLGAGVEVARALPADEGERQRRLRTAGRVLTRRLPGAGGLIAPRAFRSEFADRRTATAGYVRALRRGDQREAMRWLQWFEERHGKSIADQTLDRALGAQR